LITCSQNIHNWLDSPKYKYVAGIFFDFKKAFDQVPHELLMKALIENHQLSPVILHWIKSYLSNRSQYVVVKNCASSRTAVIGCSTRKYLGSNAIHRLYGIAIS
jgi:Reverse transcriptase (RNA-dependent DNA polymerase)